MDGRDSTKMPTRIARLPANCRGGIHPQRHFYVCGEVTKAVNLVDAVMGDEEEAAVDIPKITAMAGHVVNVLAPMLPLSTIHSCRHFSYQATKIRHIDEQ